MHILYAVSTTTLCWMLLKDYVQRQHTNIGHTGIVTSVTVLALHSFAEIFHLAKASYTTNATVLLCIGTWVVIH